MSNPRVTVNDKLFRNIALGMTDIVNALLEEKCSSRGIYGSQWYDNPPDTWTEEETFLFDILSEFDHRASEHIKKTLLKT